MNLNFKKKTGWMYRSPTFVVTIRQAFSMSITLPCTTMPLKLHNGL